MRFGPSVDRLQGVGITPVIVLPDSLYRDSCRSSRGFIGVGRKKPTGSRRAACMGERRTNELKWTDERTVTDERETLMVCPASCPAAGACHSTEMLAAVSS
jgi:hypothetical protein